MNKINKKMLIIFILKNHDNNFIIINYKTKFVHLNLRSKQ